MVAVPIFRDGAIDGAILGRSVRAPEVQQAIEELRGDRLTALGVAVAVAVLVSFLIASAITSRVKRLAESAARISEGELDEPLEGTGGRDEITDLGRALETMRGALRQTFSALREERDRLSAIFEALSDAVMVVQPDGEVRFSNAAARELDRPGRTGDRPADSLAATGVAPRCGRERRAAGRQPRLLAQRPRAAGRGRGAGRGPRPHRGAAARGRRARVRLQRGARAAQPDRRASRARSRSCARAPRTTRRPASTSFAGSQEDSERISRLTESLLTLARMEAVGEGGAEALDVDLVIEESVEAVAAPEGVEVVVELDGRARGAGRPGAAAPGADRPADERVQEHAGPGHGDRALDAGSGRRGADRGRSTPARGSPRRRSTGSSSASIAARGRWSRRDSVSASRSPGGWST